MSYILNDKIRNLTPYQPICGDYRIRLDANESFKVIDREIIQQALGISLNRYPDPYASKLCDAFADLYNINACYVTAGNGSDELISLIVGAFFSAGDTLLTLSNDFSMYRFYGDVFGIKTNVFNKESDLTIDADKLIEYVNQAKPAGIIFSNPCNPTSLVLDRESIVKIISNVDCLVVIDEAYMDFSDQSILDICHTFDNCIVLRTCSKAIGMAAIRLGFAVANGVITNALRAVKSPYNVNALTQSIGEIVLSDKEYIADCVRELIESRNFLYRELVKLNSVTGIFEQIYKSETNFIYIKTSSDKAKEIFTDLLDRSIAVRNMGEYLRITAGSMPENEKLLEALKKHERL